MKIPHDKFCILPWISLEASPIGTVRPCCLADDEIMDDAGNKFHLREANFDAIQNSAYMRDLRQQFLDQQQPQTCRKCWNEERAGRTSKRMHTLDRFKHIVDDATGWTQQAEPLIFLDLKLGNICNLKCRICGSWSSSQYAAEELADLGLDVDRKATYPYFMLRAGAWPREADRFWHEVDSVSDQIRYIEFTGGEPFMIQEHFDLLQRLIDRGVAPLIEIHYNTNGTHFPDQAADTWRHFKTVEIAFSIDDVGKRFEYQRTNAEWCQVCDNLQRFRELRSSSPNITLQACCTINVFNIYYLDEVADWLSRQKFNFVYWNMLHEAWYFSIACLPDQVKKKIIDRLEHRQFGVYTDQITRVCEFMRRGASTDGFMTRMKIRDLDRKRQQNLAEVAPEFATIMEYNFDA
jgi:MoaA/NifB/PqqE/SkfB family radical SAM enzyme